MVLDLNASEALQFAGIAAVTYLVMWWVVRPLSFVYRLEQGRLAVRTFFFLPMASVRLSEISQVEVSRPHDGKPVRWLISPYRRWSGQTLFAETKHEWVALPDRFAGELAARPSQANKVDELPAQFRGDSGYQRVLAALMTSNRAVRKLASWCVPLTGAAAWCLILLPLWLTAVELVGFKLFADEHHLAWSRVFDRVTWPHFAASAFVVVCGIAVRGLVSLGKPLPWSIAGISLSAAVSRLSLAFPGAHDVLSHTLFDSCTGYAERHGLVGITCLVAATVLALAAWNPDRARIQSAEEAEGFAATP